MEYQFLWLDQSKSLVHIQPNKTISLNIEWLLVNKQPVLRPIYHVDIDYLWPDNEPILECNYNISRNDPWSA